MGCEHRSVPGCGGIGGAVPVGMGNPRSWWALGMGQGAAVSLAGQPAVPYRAIPCHTVPARPPRAVAGWVLLGFPPHGDAVEGGHQPGALLVPQPAVSSWCLLSLFLCFTAVDVFLLKGNLCSSAIVPEAGPSC